MLAKIVDQLHEKKRIQIRTSWLKMDESTWNYFSFSLIFFYFRLNREKKKKTEKLAQKYPRKARNTQAENCDYNCSQQLWNKRRGKKSIVMRANKYTLEKSKTKQMPTVLKEGKSNWTLALSSRAFQVRKIDRINTYLAVYGTVWRLKINSHQHDTMQKENAIREKQKKSIHTRTINERKKCTQHRTLIGIGTTMTITLTFVQTTEKKHVCTFFFCIWTHAKLTATLFSSSWQFRRSIQLQI